MSSAYGCDCCNSENFSIRYCSDLDADRISLKIRTLKLGTTYVDLSNQEELTNEHLKELTLHPNCASVIRVDLEDCSNITYKGIRALLKSPILGSERWDDPVYNKRSNLPVSVVKIEIEGTKAIEEYEEYLMSKEKAIFPLPLQDDFVIKYMGYGYYLKEKEIGHKKIEVTNDGKIFPPLKK